ncbi:MAG TPA: flavin monoamine oxidase family protein [Chloroflexota bacterium]
MQALQADFVVVGAGYAGLTAALRLTQAGRSVVVLEARDRVGGRVYTQTLPDGSWLDFGGTWFGPGQEYSYALAREMGVPTYPTYVEGESLVVMDDGKIVRNAGSFPLSALLSAAAALLLMTEFESMGKRLPLERPWEAPEARAWDRQTVASWLDSQLGDAMHLAKTALSTIMTGVFTSDVAEISLLHALYLVRSHQGFERLMAVTGGDQQDRVMGGMQAIAERMKDRLGADIRLNAPVRAIRQDDRGAEVVADTATVRAQRVIVTLPPWLTGGLRYDPPLPAERALLAQRTPSGSVIKVLIKYDTPFWRAKGLSGQSFAVTDPVGATFDGCTDTATAGLMIAFAFGPQARELARLSKPERQHVFIDALVRRFGPEAAAPTTEYHEHDWADEDWSRGGILVHFPPGVLTSFGPALTEPCGRIHWAGTETSTRFYGSINGAIESGERAAQEVLRA